MAVHPGKGWISDSIRRELFWLHMADNGYSTVSSCSMWRHNGSRQKIKKNSNLHRRRTAGVHVNIHSRALTRSTQNNQYVILTANRYTKLTTPIAVGSKTATHVTKKFFDLWIIPYGKHTHDLTNNGVRITSKLFAMLCTRLRVKQLTVTAYHTQDNAHIERYNRMIVTRRRHYVAENQRDRDGLVQPLTIVDIMQVHKFNGTLPFSLVLTRHSPVLPTVNRQSELTRDMHTEASLRAIGCRCKVKSTHCESKYTTDFIKSRRISKVTTTHGQQPNQR